VRRRERAVPPRGPRARPARSGAQARRFSRQRRGNTGSHVGQIFTFFVIAIAAAEAAVGLAIVLAFFRVRKSVRSDEADLLRN
jgi:hypothetical protein